MIQLREGYGISIMPAITNTHGFLKKAWPTTHLLFMWRIRIHQLFAGLAL
jgi:hypothetical protein